VVVTNSEVHERVNGLAWPIGGDGQHISRLVGHGGHDHFVEATLDAHHGARCMVAWHDLIDEVTHDARLADTAGATDVQLTLFAEEELKEPIDGSLLSFVEGHLRGLCHGGVSNKRPPCRGPLVLLVAVSELEALAAFGLASFDLVIGTLL